MAQFISVFVKNNFALGSSLPNTGFLIAFPPQMHIPMINDSTLKVALNFIHRYPDGSKRHLRTTLTYRIGLEDNVGKHLPVNPKDTPYVSINTLGQGFQAAITRILTHACSKVHFMGCTYTVESTDAMIQEWEQTHQGLKFPSSGKFHHPSVPQSPCGALSTEYTNTYNVGFGVYNSLANKGGSLSLPVGSRGDSAVFSPPDSYSAQVKDLVATVRVNAFVCALGVNTPANFVQLVLNPCVVVSNKGYYLDHFKETSFRKLHPPCGATRGIMNIGEGQDV